MKRRSRNILFGSILAIFFLVAPIVIFYARGFSLNPENGEVIKTGIVHIEVNLPQMTVSVDHEPDHNEREPIIIKGLTPGNHNVRLSRAGYQDWSVEVPVEPEKVTRIEKVMLIATEPELEEPITGAIGTFEISPNSRYILFSLEEGKDEGLWLHTTQKEKNRQLITKNQIDTSAIESLRWSGNSKVAIVARAGKRYSLISPHISNPSLQPLKYLEGLEPEDIFFDEDEPTTLYYLKADHRLFRWKTGIKNSLPEQLASDVRAFSINNPKIFLLQQNEQVNQIASIDLRLSSGEITPIIDIPQDMQADQMFVSTGRHIAFLASNNELWLLQRKNGSFKWGRLAENVDFAEWSPDSRYLLFSKSTELWAYDQEALSNESPTFLITRLSNIPETISWFPDSSHLRLEDQGDVEISLLHVSRVTPQIQKISLPEQKSDIQYARAGKDLLFISEQNGKKSIVVATITELEDN